MTLTEMKAWVRQSMTTEANAEAKRRQFPAAMMEAGEIHNRYRDTFANAVQADRWEPQIQELRRQHTSVKVLSRTAEYAVVLVDGDRCVVL